MSEFEIFFWSIQKNFGHFNSVQILGLYRVSPQKKMYITLLDPY